MNKDESYRCLEKAEEHIKDKKFDLAEVFILKSKKLFALPKADGMFIGSTFYIELIFNYYVLELLKKIQELQEISKLNYTEEQANIVKK